MWDFQLCEQWAGVYTSCSIYVVIRGVTGAAGGRAAPPPHRGRHCGQWRYSQNIFSAFIWFIWLQYSIQPTTTDVDAIYTLNVSNQQETTKAIMTFCSSVHIRCNFVRILRFRNNFSPYLLELSTKFHSLNTVSRYKIGTLLSKYINQRAVWSAKTLNDLYDLCGQVS